MRLYAFFSLVVPHIPIVACLVFPIVVLLLLLFLCFLSSSSSSLLLLPGSSFSGGGENIIKSLFYGRSRDCRAQRREHRVGVLLHPR